MSKVQVLTAGTSTRLDAHISYSTSNPHAYSLPPTHALVGIVGVAIAGSNDHVYVWYDDGTVSSGTSWDLDHHEAPHQYSLPPGKTPADIVGIGIAGSNDRVYTWFDDGTFSVGSSSNLDAHQGLEPFSLPPGKTTAGIVGMAIAGSNDHIYTWFDDLTVSEGRSDDLARYAAPKPFSLPGGLGIDDVVDMAIAGSNDRVYVWYRRMAQGEAPSAIRKTIDEIALAFMKEFRVTGMTLAVTRNGRGIVSRGYGYASIGENRAMHRKTRSRIGSVSKILAALGWMKLTEQNPALSEQMPVYGPAGVLKDIGYAVEAQRGFQRFSPLIDVAIAPSSDHCYAWYDNGTVSSGTSRDLDQHTAPRSYSLPPGKTPKDIRAIGIAGSNERVFVWYDDGSISSGTSQDLDKHFYEPKGETSGHNGSLGRVLAKAIATSNDRVYTWYDDGRVSAGTSREPHKHSKLEPFVVPPGKSRYDIRGIGIASDDRVYTWYTDGTVSVGSSRDLGKHNESYGYTLPPGIVSSPDGPAWFNSMTVAHLLTHSAGFVHSGDVGGAMAMFGVAEEDLTYEQAHKYMLRTRKLLFPPGSRWRYSNHGMGLLGHLVATASNTPLHQYVTDNVFSVAEVDDPGEGIVPIDLAGGALDSDVHKYHREIPGVIDAKKPAPSGKVGVGLAAGGWAASAESLVRLCLATDRLPNRPDVLQSATLAKMEAPYLPGIGARGLGWRVGREASGAIKVAHSGSRGDGKAYLAKFLPGYKLSTGVDVGNMNVAVCLNIAADAGSGDLINLTTAVVDAVAAGMVPLTYDFFADVQLRRIA